MSITKEPIFTVYINITLGKLWKAYGGKKESGRVECPIRTHNGNATHIYKGYGAIRLEAISGKPVEGKGFQGETVVQGTSQEYVRIQD